MSILRTDQICPLIDCESDAAALNRSRLGWCAGDSYGFTKSVTMRTGKADAFWTGNVSDCVWGVVYGCRIEEQPLLDRAESLGVGYEQVPVDVHTNCGTISTFLYQAKLDRIDTNLRPAPWYHLHVVTGAREHSLPLDYQRMIESYDEQDNEGDPVPPIFRTG